MQAPTDIDTKSLIRRILFFTILVGLATVYTFITFKGLTSSQGMDQAQIGREVARGHNLTTKFIRPLALHQLEESDKPYNMNAFRDTTHSPLNVLIYAGVIKIAGGTDANNTKMAANDNVFYLDKVIAGTCTFFFMLSIGINYLLASKIFDAKIGSFVAILMLVSQSFWEYTLSGLPQMLMLCIFSAACYLIWKAIDNQEAERSPVVPIVLAGFLFGLLALAHWLTLWIFLGFLIFAIFYFRPRGIISAFLILTMAFFIAGPLLFNANNSDGIFGTAFYYVQGKVGFKQDFMFRAFSTPTMDVGGLVASIVKTTFLQANEIHKHLGGFVLVTAFFLSLIHPFKRKSITSYKWCILLMWVFAALGMSIYGLSDNALDSNQLHILFMPLMTAFALALVSILWARIPMSQEPGFASLLPFAIIIMVTASPLVIDLYERVRIHSHVHTVPGYNPSNLNRELTKYVDKADIVYSDQPWAVAWYADRIAIWLPATTDNIDDVADAADKSNGNITGMHLSPFRYQLRLNAGYYARSKKLFPHETQLIQDQSFLLLAEKPEDK